MFRSVLVFSVLSVLKLLSRIFYRFDFGWVGKAPEGDPWSHIRLIAFLNHTSLMEPIFLGVVPSRFLWRLARHGVIPAADKTTNRPLVGLIYKFVAANVVAISRQRDHTWTQVLSSIDPDSMVVIAPEGRMKRANGLDVNGHPMSVRGGVADIIEAMPNGRMLIAYSGGLHHVQIPGERPKIFKKVRLRVEDVEISDYRDEMMKVGGADGFKRSVMNDLDRRRDEYSPTEEKIAENAKR